MVCLSFEQSVLKKTKNKKKQKNKKICGGGGKGGMVYSQKLHRWDFCSVFVLAWYSYARALKHDSRNGVWNSCLM